MSSAGRWRRGRRIWITADDAPPDKAFDKWVGDTQGLGKNGLTEAHTILTMPASDVTLAATYKDFKSIRVACIGDTPTDMTNYPKELGKLLNAAHEAGKKDAGVYDVRNYAQADSTIVQAGYPWTKSNKFPRVKTFLPNIVVIMMGTQDCQKGQNLGKIATFVPEYEKLIGEFAALPTKPRIFICLPPPIMGDGAWGMTDENLETKVVPGVKQVAKDLDLPLIDINVLLRNRPELFRDNVHLVGESKNIIADAVYKALMGQGETAATTRAAGDTTRPGTRP